ncbi:MAG: leucine-rich repeat domain-containing protein, partial [Proteobacteria bacterium]|nr:leucine-rich repeat domain-containing protein [Pseudomonadota bacterium]
MANLTNLTELILDTNSISDISPLANLTNLTSLNLGFNSISDISPLANLTNLTSLDLERNPLNYPAIHTHIPALESKGVSVSYDDRTPASLHKISGDETASDNSLLIVEVKGSKNLPFEGVPVSFAIVSGGGALSVTSATTDAQGRAQSELTLGSDGEPNRVTVSAVPFGLEALFTVGQSAVNIPDLNLRTAIAEALGKALNDTFFTSEMATLTELAASGISDLTGLERATNLTTLDLRLSSGSISGLSSLANLTKLTEFKISSGRISDVSPLADLTNLTVLSLWVGSMSDLSSLAGLTNLRELSLGEPHGLDSSTLPSLANLQALNIWGWTWRWAG